MTGAALASPIDAPTFSTLLLLFANEWAPSGRGRTAVPVPCSDAVVDAEAAAPELVAGALWALADAGAISITAMERPMTEVIENYRRVSGMEPPPGAFVERDVQVRVLRPVSAEGLEGQLGAAPGPAGEMRVEDAIEGWLSASARGLRFRFPELHVITAVGRIAEGAGLASYSGLDVQSARRGFGLSALLGKTKVENADCAAIADLKPRFDELLARYRAWAGADPELHKTLVSKCGSGIGARAIVD